MNIVDAGAVQVLQFWRAHNGLTAPTWNVDLNFSKWGPNGDLILSEMGTKWGPSATEMGTNWGLSPHLVP